MPNPVRRFLNDLRTAWNQFQADDGTLLSAAVAYFIALSLFPLLLVLIAGTGLFLRYTNLGHDAEQQVLRAVSEHLSPSLGQQVQATLTQVQDRSAINGPVGLVTTLIAVLAAFAQFENAFDRIWKVPRPTGTGMVAAIRRLIVQRGMAFLLLLTLGLVIVAGVISGIALNWMRTSTAAFVEVPEPVWNGLHIGSSVLLNLCLFTAIYRWLPRAPVRWSEAVRGGAVTALLWELGRQLLAAHLISTKYSSAYGVVGSFIGVMVWLQYAAMVVFFGAEYVRAVCRGCGTGPGPARRAD